MTAAYLIENSRSTLAFISFIDVEMLDVGKSFSQGVNTA